MEEQKDLILSIYPDPSVVEHELNYSTQIVQKPNYYPKHLQVLIDKINESSSPIEIEQSIDRFVSYISEKRSELIDMARLFRKRENINQRSLYLVVDQFDNTINRLDGKGQAYIAGPIGGGSNTLDHDLTEAIPDKWSYLIQFEDNHVAHTIENVELRLLEGSSLTLIIHDDIDHEFGIQNLPFEMAGVELTLKRAYNYYEDKYQQASAINDFSPLIDSGFAAAQAIIKANLIYFDSFPRVLRERMELYSLTKTHHPNFLTIQKIKTDLLRDEEISILGYTFSSGNREFSVINRSFFKGLKLFLLAENDINSSNIVFNSLVNNSDLKHIIEDFERQNQSLGTRGAVNQFEGRKSETIREIIGLDNLQKMISISGSSRIEIPVAYIEVTKGIHEIVYTTSLTDLEFPKYYLSAIENLYHPLDLLATGPLKLFNYKIDEISVYIKIADYRFRISKSQTTGPNNERIILYYNFQSQADYELVRKNTNNNIDEAYIKNFLTNSFTNFDEIFESVKSIKPARQVELGPEEMAELIQKKRPVTSYARAILQEHVVEILLKRVLNEIITWEDGISSKSSINRTIQNIRERETREELTIDYLDHPQYKLKSDLGLSASIEESKTETKRDSEAQFLLTKLSKEIDEFNPGFFNFIINTLRRESSNSLDNTSILYKTVIDIFQDVKVAIVDFGLRPVDWASAENLQLWNTYQAQIRYIEHSLILKLSEIIGVHYDGEELNHLTTYFHIINMVFTSFNGVIDGHTYVKLKKAFLYLTPKLIKYKDVLEKSSSLLELLGFIENFDEEARRKVRATLPQLPRISTQRS